MPSLTNQTAQPLRSDSTGSFHNIVMPIDLLGKLTTENGDAHEAGADRRKHAHDYIIGPCKCGRTHDQWFWLKQLKAKRITPKQYVIILETIQREHYAS